MKPQERPDFSKPADLSLAPVSDHSGTISASHRDDYDGGFSLLDRPAGKNLESVEASIRLNRKRTDFQEFTCK